MLSPGTQLGSYRIEGLLGRGGMGIVYEATQLSLQRHVALKLLSAELGADASFRARFQREGRLHAAIDHAHIVPIYDSGELEDAGLYIAMRLVRGPNLKELVLSGELEPQRALRLLGPVADALDTAHEAGLVHRDIKPQNILVGPRDHGYLADFGLTRAPGDTAFTKTGQFVGTLDYIAPEQILGEHPGSGSDVYSFAAVVYECLTQSVPYPRPTEAAVLFAHVHDAPPRASTRVPELEPVDEILERAMAKDPSERHATALSLIQELAIALPQTVVAPRRERPRRPPPRPATEPDRKGETDSERCPETDPERRPEADPGRKPPKPGLAPEPAQAARGRGEATIAPELAAADERAAAQPAPAPAPAPAASSGASAAQHAPPATRPASGPAPEREPDPDAQAGVGELTIQRSRRGWSTASDLRRPWPAPGAEAPSAPRTIRVSKVLVAAALGLLALSVAVGLLAGGDDDRSTNADVAAGASFGAGAIAMHAPAGWRTTSLTAPDGLTLRHGRAFAPRAGAAASLVAGMTSGAGATLLPRTFARQLAATPKGEPVKMGELEALRYAELRPAGATRVVTVLVAPTTQGVATVVCSGTAAQRSACEAAAATARAAPGAEGYPLAPREDYAKAAGGVLGRLADGRSTVRTRWRAQTTRTAQAQAAASLAARFATAAREFARLPAGPRERTAQGRIVAELRAVAARLTAMARAARAGHERDYARARTTERAHEQALRAAVRLLDDVGYRVR